MHRITGKTLGVEIRANGCHENVFKLFQVARRNWNQACKKRRRLIISQVAGSINLTELRVNIYVYCGVAKTIGVNKDTFTLQILPRNKTKFNQLKLFFFAYIITVCIG